MRFQDLRFSAFAEAGTEIELKHPVTGERTGWKIRVRGTDAPSLQALQLEQRRRRMEHLAKQGHDRVDPSQFDEETLEMLVAATLGWSGVEAADGVPFEFNAGNARVAYAEKWIREQVAAAMASRANFLPRSASAS